MAVIGGRLPFSAQNAFRATAHEYPSASTAKPRIATLTQKPEMWWPRNVASVMGSGYRSLWMPS